MNYGSAVIRSAALLLIIFSSCSKDAFRLQVLLPASVGLKKGSEVRYRGICVGYVSEIALEQSANLKPGDAIARLLITDKHTILREGDEFRIATAGLLGEDFIDVIPTSSDSRPLQPNSTVQLQTSPLSTLKGNISYLGAVELAERLDLLPPEKRDAMMNKFREMVEQALKEQGQPTGNPATSGTKR